MMQVMGFEAGIALSKQGDLPQAAFAAQLDSIRGARVLLVEDNEINQQVACELLQSIGCNVDVADNGKIAISMIQALGAGIDV